MASGSITRMVLHDVLDYHVIIIRCEDVRRLSAPPDDVLDVGCMIEAEELGTINRYYVQESYENVTAYVAHHAPEVYATFCVGLSER